jgi:hypothetical protein
MPRLTLTPGMEKSQPAPGAPTLTKDELDVGKRLWVEYRKALRAAESARAKIEGFADGLDEKYDYRSKGLDYEADTRRIVPARVPLR